MPSTERLERWELSKKVGGGVRFILATLGLLLLPVLFGTSAANTVLVLAVFAMGYNLLLGYGGELSFGHAALFGFGAYGTVLISEYLIADLYIAVVLSIILTTIVSVIFGFLSLRRRGIYLAMITLALAQMMYYAAFQWSSITGGGDGKALPMFSAPLGPIDPLEAGFQFYIFGFIVLVLCWFAIRRIIQSPFGRALMAIRESESRAQHLGYSVDRLLLLAFVLSGMFAGVAGALHAILYAFVGPDLLFWTMSGEVVLITILGGMGTINGPIVGAVIFGILSTNLTNYTQNWPIIFGSIFVLIVIFAPEGVYGLYRSYIENERTFNVQDLLKQLGLRSE